MNLEDAIRKAFNDMDPDGKYDFSYSEGLKWVSNDRDGDRSTTRFDENEFIQRVASLLVENLSENQTIIECNGKRYLITTEELP